MQQTDTLDALSLVKLLDTIEDETGIITKNKKGQYNDLNLTLTCLSAIWNNLNWEKKARIGMYFVNALFDYKPDEIVIEKLQKKHRKLPLLALISPASDNNGNIIYSISTEKFLNIDEATELDLMHCWYFKPTFLSSVEELISLLNSKGIKYYTDKMDFLLQSITIQEIHLNICSG